MTLAMVLKYKLVIFKMNSCKPLLFSFSPESLRHAVGNPTCVADTQAPEPRTYTTQKTDKVITDPVCKGWAMVDWLPLSPIPCTWKRCSLNDGITKSFSSFVRRLPDDSLNL